MEKILLSICVPVYNEWDNLDAFYKRISTFFSNEPNYKFELLFTDNHSTDGTFEKLADLAAEDPRIRIIRFSKNFGFQKSIMTNYLNARGSAAIQIDCDLQDPPEMISQFIRKWEQGFKVVYGIRRSRPESRFLHFLRKTFYRFLDALSEDDLPHDAGDFRLIDRCIIEELKRTQDGHPYIRGLIATMGFKQIGIPYDRDNRHAGESKFNTRQLLGLAFDGILQHSTIPLRIATFTGLFISFLAMLGAIYYFIARLTHNDWPRGLASNSILILFNLGMNAIFLGIMGEYIGKIYKNVKNQPFTIIEAEIDSQN